MWKVLNRNADGSGVGSSTTRGGVEVVVSRIDSTKGVAETMGSIVASVTSAGVEGSDWEVLQPPKASIRMITCLDQDLLMYTCFFVSVPYQSPA
jgi:hypothetical protein